MKINISKHLDLAAVFGETRIDVGRENERTNVVSIS